MLLAGDVDLGEKFADLAVELRGDRGGGGGRRHVALVEEARDGGVGHAGAGGELAGGPALLGQPGDDFDVLCHCSTLLDCSTLIT